MTEALEPSAEENTEPVGPGDVEPSPDGMSPFRASLMDAVAVQSKAPNLIEQVYTRVGLTAPPNATTFDTQVSVGKIRPGDLVGWHGGNTEQGYQGNLAVYAGNREIIEPFFQTVRRRKIADNENVFGIPVVLPNE